VNPVYEESRRIYGYKSAGGGSPIPSAGGSSRTETQNEREAKVLFQQCRRQAQVQVRRGSVVVAVERRQQQETRGTAPKRRQAAMAEL